jgi:hypothetical protein
MEDGHPADIPEGAIGVEMYTGHRAGGRSESLFVRWAKKVSGVRELREVLGTDLAHDKVRGFLVLDADITPTEEVLDRLFLLTGMSTLDSPPARFQPSALPDILQLGKAVALIHRDKHGPAVGFYSREPLNAEGRLSTLCEKESALFVRFAIPPMLARWDRALAELRTTWEATRSEPFPVPASERPSNWEPRRRRRGVRDRFADEAMGDSGPDDLGPDSLGSDTARRDGGDDDFDLDADALAGILEQDDAGADQDDEPDTGNTGPADDDDSDEGDGDEEGEGDDGNDDDDGDDGNDDEGDDDDDDDDDRYGLDRDDESLWGDDDADPEEDPLVEGDEGDDGE